MKKYSLLFFGILMFFGFSLNVKADGPTLTYSTHVQDEGSRIY